jgi:two-component system sensor histidine kinase KdpD
VHSDLIPPSRPVLTEVPLKPGILRVYLGAASGVGTTFAMLMEGHRLAAAGDDVVIGVVDAHGRAKTARAAEGLEPLSTVHSAAGAPEMDLDVVLTRHAKWVLVDELAHANPPGSSNPFRWQDIDAMTAAGVNVITTVTIQHLESLTDVVRSITGVEQDEILPDWVLRTAAQIELVDLSPERLRERLAAGELCEARAVDAKLAHYFRLGNVIALRELALLWLADEVDGALREYQQNHGIRETWEARERVVVALPGGPEGETLIRRGARIATRSGRGIIYAVHAYSLASPTAKSRDHLTAQMELLASLGGTFHQLPSRQPARDLVEFARSVNATQLVIGDTPHGRLYTLLRGPGIGHAIIRASGDIDVHTVTLNPRRASH